MVRRPVAWVTALVLLAEAVGVAWINWFMGVVVDRQDMSLAGLDPDVMSTSSKVAGLVFGLYFALCGLAALRVALRDRAPALPGRILLISAAVVHALLGAFTVGLVGWGAFAFMTAVLGLIVLVLVAYDRRETAGATGVRSPAGRDGGPPGGGPAHAGTVDAVPAGGGSAAPAGAGPAGGDGGAAPVVPPPPAASAP